LNLEQEPIYIRKANLGQEINNIYADVKSQIDAIIRYFRYWHTISPIGPSGLSILRFGNEKRKIEIVEKFYNEIENNMDESVINELIKTFLRLMICTEIQDVTSLTEKNKANYAQKIGTFTSYVLKMQANSNRFSHLAYENRKRIYEWNQFTTSR